jgi:YD repeat-containing protein
MKKPFCATTNSPLVGQILFTNSGALRMTTTKQYDLLNRLLSVSSSPSAASAVSFSYLYNNANQRLQTVLADGSQWIYEYDSLGQVVSGRHFWADWTPVAGQQFAYAFDDGPEFDLNYERPVNDAIAKLRARKVPDDICKTRLPKDAKPWAIRNDFDNAMCQCGINAPPKAAQ